MIVIDFLVDLRCMKLSKITYSNIEGTLEYYDNRGGIRMSKLNLASYSKMEGPTRSNAGEYIKFETTGETRYLRFLYESGGDNMGEDVTFYRKHWDNDQKKFIYGSEEGTLTATLRCIEYDADGSNPRLVRWERSAYFCKNVLLPMWKNYPRIIDGVWKVTATSPKTIDASYALFPIMNADTIKYPIIDYSPEIEKEDAEEEAPVEETPPARTSKYWE